MAPYLITQASGQQSRQVISHLLAAGAKIHAVVRDPQKLDPVLHDPNVTVFQGESKNYNDILQAAHGCTAVFLNTVPFPGLELLQATTIVDACREAGVARIVAATSHGTANKAMWDDDAAKATGLHEYFVSKAAVEAVVRGAAGFSAYTIVRPAVLHHDFFVPGARLNFPRLPTHGVLDHLCLEGARLPYTDAHDVGRYAAAALMDPATFGGAEIDLGNELLTMEEVGEILVRVSGRQVEVTRRTLEEVEKLGIAVFGQRFHLWANVKDLNWTTSVAKEVQEKFGIPFTSLEEALRRDSARLLDCLPAAS
ncbi:unnamed protein product [Discula destructiva]